MAPAASRLRAEAGLGALPRRALAAYLLLLRLHPVLTKAATSGILSALGNILAQMIEKRKRENSPNLDVTRPLRYAAYGGHSVQSQAPFTYTHKEWEEHVNFVTKMRSSFWPALQTNWKVWTPLHFINISYVPPQFWVLFANLVALFWYTYLASLRK
ncbi:peroxisomal membrane protein 2 [Ochotona princeps]|uniref:peroxisomal membrane protein 2 n=1 Tax=Ochotona princeps TaxID=9978 RepID=UPI0027146D91|nr:peroxisomal membrane protein 2 [Ochotona princeps]